MVRDGNDRSLTYGVVVCALYRHGRMGRAQDATVTRIVRLSFGMGYPAVEFVEQIMDLEQQMKSK